MEEQPYRPGQQIYELVRRRREGVLSRRAFLQAVTALGLSLPLAMMLERHGLAALQEAAPSGGLTVVLPRRLVALDPHGAQSVEEATAVISSHIFDTLVVRDPATGELSRA